MGIEDVRGSIAALARSTIEVDSASAQLQGAGAPPSARLDTPSTSWRRVALAAGAPAYQAMPARTGYAPDAVAFAAAERGYAATATATTVKATATQASATKSTKTTSKASTAKSSSSSKKTSTKTSTTAKKTAASAELAFLDDPHLSIEDKLFRFMALMQQKSDRELTEAMKSYEEKKTAAAKEKSTSSAGGGSSGSSTEKKSSGGGGGLFGALGDALGGIAKTVVSGAESLAKDFGGPLLAAGATAVGLPFLAPVALEIGGPLARSAVSGLASAVGLDELGGSAAKSSSTTRPSSAAGSSSASKATSSASASTAATADDAEFDERLEMMKLQRLVEKQQTMFAALSNVLKAMHEGQMVAVNNIR